MTIIPRWGWIIPPLARHPPRGARAIVAILALVILAAPTPGLSAQEIVPPPPGHRTLYFCDVPDAIELKATELHHWDAMTDPDAFMARGVRVMRDGSLLVVDAQAPAVYHVSSDYRDVRQIGGGGEGPGEYRFPHDAIQWGADGGFVIADRGAAALLFYHPDGSYQRSARIMATINSIAADDRHVYVAGTIPRRGQGARLLLMRYDPSANRWTTVLDFDPAMAGRASANYLPAMNPLVRIGLDGEVYLGLSELYRIGRVGNDGRVEEVVRGCLPDDLARRYRADGGARRMRMFATLISDFAVLEDGDVVVRVGHFDRERRRPIERFDRHGEKQGTWLVPAETAPWGFAALHPIRPFEVHVTWVPSTGSTRVFEYRLPK